MIVLPLIEPLVVISSSGFVDDTGISLVEASCAPLMKVSLPIRAVDALVSCEINSMDRSSSC